MRSTSAHEIGIRATSAGSADRINPERPRRRCRSGH
jgi:hypothetical protein